MTPLFVIMLIAILFVWAFVGLALVQQIGRLSSPESLLDDIENGKAVLEESPEYAMQTQWARENGFVPETMLDFFGGAGRITMGVWKHRAKKTRLASYDIVKLSKVVYEFTTDLENGYDLSTSSSRDANTFPYPPGKYVQTFDRMALVPLLEKHEEGLAHLGQYMNVIVTDRPESEYELIIKSMRDLVMHVKSIPLWQLRGAYWYFVRRRLMNNKSVADQYPA